MYLDPGSVCSIVQHGSAPWRRGFYVQLWAQATIRTWIRIQQAEFGKNYDTGKFGHKAVGTV